LFFCCSTFVRFTFGSIGTAKGEGYPGTPSPHKQHGPA